MDSSQQSAASASYATRLDDTLKTLQKRVAEQEALLEELRSHTTPIEIEPSFEPRARLKQLRTLKATYDSLIPTAPWMPPSDSLLPALLALRDTDKIIRESGECNKQLESELKAVTARVDQEKADLRDAKLIQEALRKRIATLEETIKTQTQKSPSQIAKDLISDAKSKKDHYDKETAELITSFNDFIDNHLAVMLAAEQLGGPVAGQNPEISAEMLEGGFSSQGKAKKASKKPDEDKRQKRLDQVWGLQLQDEDGDAPQWDDKAAAAADMRELTEQLLNNLVEADGKGPGTYVQLQRDSAAARFLVRAKVAHFHPTNGTKIRLFDFGGEIDEYSR